MTETNRERLGLGVIIALGTAYLLNPQLFAGTLYGLVESLVTYWQS
jgi:hypothetical protein